MRCALVRAVELALVGLVVTTGACSSRDTAEEPARAPALVVPSSTVEPSAPPPAPPPPPDTPDARSLAPAPNPACVLTESDIELADDLSLRVEESAPFLHVREAKKLEVRLASPRSTVQASRSDLDVVGHVKLTDVPVRLRSDALVHGYLRLHRTRLRDGDPAQLALTLPKLSFLAPVKELGPLPVTCDELALARRTVRPATARGKAIGLQKGKAIDLRATPGGPVVATLSFRKPDPKVLEPMPFREVFEIERRGEEVLVRIETRGMDVEGWVPQGDVEPPAQVAMLGALGGGGSRETTIALAGALPLLVRTGGDVVRIGTARQGTFSCRVPSSPEAREVQLDLSPSLADEGIHLGPGPAPAKPTLFVVPRPGETCGPNQSP